MTVEYILLVFQHLNTVNEKRNRFEMDVDMLSIAIRLVTQDKLHVGVITWLFW